MSIDVRLLREALQAQPTEDDEHASDLAIEKAGDQAFDWILGEMRGGRLTPRECVRALRLLARITRQFCVRRKGEVLDIALTFAQDSYVDRDLRSAAIHVAIMSARIAKGLGDARLAYGRSVEEIDDQVSQAARRAAELGVTPELGRFIQEFFSTGNGGGEGDHREGRERGP